MAVIGSKTLSLIRKASEVNDVTVSRLSPHTSHPHGIIGSAQRITVARLKDVKKQSLTGWQEDAWDAYGLVGEYWYLVNKLADKASTAKLIVATVPDDPTAEPTPSDDPVANATLDMLVAAMEGTSEFLRRAVLNILVTGEVWLVGVTTTSREPVLSDYAWHVLSSSEVRVSGSNTWELTLADGTRASYPEGRVCPIRIWRRHPKEAFRADAATSAALPILRELIELTKAVSAVTDSRLAGAGVLFVADEVKASFKRASTSDGMDEEYGVNCCVLECRNVDDGCCPDQTVCEHGDEVIWGTRLGDDIPVLSCLRLSLNVCVGPLVHNFLLDAHLIRHLVEVHGHTDPNTSLHEAESFTSFLRPNIEIPGRPDRVRPIRFSAFECEDAPDSDSGVMPATILEHFTERDWQLPPPDCAQLYESSIARRHALEPDGAFPLGAGRPPVGEYRRDVGL